MDNPTADPLCPHGYNLQFVICHRCTDPAFDAAKQPASTVLRAELPSSKLRLSDERLAEIITLFDAGNPGGLYGDAALSLKELSNRRAADRLPVPAMTCPACSGKCCEQVCCGQPHMTDDGREYCCGNPDVDACSVCQAEGTITTVQQYLKTVPADWHKDSSLERWFPLTGEQMRLQTEQIKDQARRVAELERDLAFRIALEDTMKDCIGVEEGQTFERRAEELIVTEVNYENLRLSPPPPASRPPTITIEGSTLRAEVGAYRYTCRIEETVRVADETGGSQS